MSIVCSVNSRVGTVISHFSGIIIIYQWANWVDLFTVIWSYGIGTYHRVSSLIYNEIHYYIQGSNFSPSERSEKLFLMCSVPKIWLYIVSSVASVHSRVIITLTHYILDSWFHSSEKSKKLFLHFRVPIDFLHIIARCVSSVNSPVCRHFTHNT